MTHSIPKPVLPFAATLSALLAVSAVVRAEEVKERVYECHRGGQVVFSSEPCGPDAETKTLDYAEPGRSATKEAIEAAQQEDTQASVTAQAELLDTEIVNAQNEVERLRVEQKERIYAWRQTMAEGTDQDDFNAWQAQMDAKLQAIETSYAQQIEDAEDKVDQLRSQRAALGSSDPGQR